MSAPTPIPLRLSRVLGYSRLWATRYEDACADVARQGAGWALLAILSGQSVYAVPDAATFAWCQTQRACVFYAVPPQVLAEVGT